MCEILNNHFSHLKYAMFHHALIYESGYRLIRLLVMILLMCVIAFKEFVQECCNQLVSSRSGRLFNYLVCGTYKHKLNDT